jgi:hypothetical protein
MATDELHAPVSAEEIFAGQMIRPLPAGTALEAAFLLVKLDDGNWCARQVGTAYNRVEFLGQLSAYTHSLLQDEADGWLDDDDDSTPPH